jgi:hypothetical protein
MKRRQFFGVTIGAVLSGCVGGSANDAPSSTTDAAPNSPANHLGDFVLWNADEEPHTITLIIRRDGEEMMNTTQTVQSGTSTRVANPIEQQGTYSIVATLEDGTEESVEWQIEACNSIEYRQIHVDGSGQIQIREMKETVDPTPECG